MQIINGLGEFIRSTMIEAVLYIIKERILIANDYTKVLFGTLFCGYCDLAKMVKKLKCN